MGLAGRLGLVFVSVVLVGACSVVLATQGAPFKDVDLLQQGTKRTEILEEFGLPLRTKRVDDGGRFDYYRVRQGSPAAVRLGRAAGYAMANLLTFGAWELVGSDVERQFAVSDAIDVRITYRQATGGKSDSISEIHIRDAESGAWIPIDEAMKKTAPQNNPQPSSTK